MNPFSFHIHGQLIADQSDEGRLFLLLLDEKPEMDTAVSLYLRFPFITIGPEEHIFPSYILDDWGHEIRGVEVYGWMVDNGDHFPRAELFGFEQDGSEAQCFVRGLEHYLKLPCYVYNDRQSPVDEGVLVRKIIIPDSDVAQLERIERPLHLERPLSSARVQWWKMGATEK